METYTNQNSQEQNSQETGKRVLAIVIFFVLLHIMNLISSVNNSPDFSVVGEDVSLSIMIIIGIIGLWIGINALSQIKNPTIIVSPIHLYTLCIGISVALFLFYCGIEVFKKPGVIIGVVTGALLLLDSKPLHTSK